MNPETRTALEASIAHWKRLAEGNSLPGESIRSESCALCEKFLRGSMWCHGCPVRDNVGVPGCTFETYLAAKDALYEHGKQSSEFHTAAKNMQTFLESLLPK